jgi:hypothetical protein
MLEKDGWCQVNDRNEVNVSERNCKRSDVPTEFCFALYANPSEFRTSEISQRGSQPSVAPVALRSLPPIYPEVPKQECDHPRGR